MGYQKHLLRFQRRDQIAKPGEYTAEIALVNSHDRSSSYQIHTALYRFICSNGLMVSDSTIEPVSIRHSGRETEEVIRASFAMLGQLPRLTEKVEAFRSRQLTPAEQHLFAERAILLRGDDLKLAPVGVEKILWPRRSEDTGADLWSTLNRVQENLLRGGQRDWHQRRENGRRIGKSRPITGLDESIRVNKQLWELAEALRGGSINLGRKFIGIEIERKLFRHRLRAHRERATPAEAFRLMSSKRKHPTELTTAADWSRINRANSANSPWRKTPISKRSAECHEYFAKLAEEGDDRRVPRPELDPD